jgi:hypothetical protein
MGIPAVANSSITCPYLLEYKEHMYRDRLAENKKRLKCKVCAVLVQT